jgi:hypothetical protein
MRARDQLLVAIVLAVTTWFGLHRIAESKNEAAVGAGVFRLEEKRSDEMAAWRRLLSQLAAMGQAPLAQRLEVLRQDERIWVAPAMGPDRWAVFVESLSLVRRVYIRRVALLDPVRHLYPVPRPDVPLGHQTAFARIGLCGALVHEIAHYDGAIEEGAAYAREFAWYEDLQAAPFVQALPEADRRAWNWALEAAVLSARKAAASAAAGAP